MGRYRLKRVNFFCRIDWLCRLYVLFSWKCSSCCNFFSIYSFPASGDFCRLLITFANSLDPIRPDKTSGLIWIQTVWHFDGIPERFFLKKLIEKKKTKKHAKLPSMQRVKIKSIKSALGFKYHIKREDRKTTHRCLGLFSAITAFPGYRHFHDYFLSFEFHWVLCVLHYHWWVTEFCALYCSDSLMSYSDLCVLLCDSLMRTE